MSSYQIPLPTCVNANVTAFSNKIFIIARTLKWNIRQFYAHYNAMKMWEFLCFNNSKTAAAKKLPRWCALIMKIVHYRRVAIDNIQREMWLEFVFAKSYLKRRS